MGSYKSISDQLNKIKMWSLLLLAVSVSSMPQTNFQFGSVPNRKIFIRGDAQETARGPAGAPSTPEVIESGIEGRVPGEEAFVGPEEVVVIENIPEEETCCCIPASEECLAQEQEEEIDLVGLGLITDQPLPAPPLFALQGTRCAAELQVLHQV